MDNNEIYWVYKHTNKINGKVYIGISRQRPYYKRWRNGNGYIHSAHFYSAIQKYGWDNFEHEILYDWVTKEFAQNKEQELIELYNSKNPMFGYNITNGGESSVWEPEQIFKISGKNNYHSKSVIIDNIEFGSISKCANYLNICHANLLNWLNGKHSCPAEYIKRGLRYSGNNEVCNIRQRKDKLSNKQIKELCRIKSTLRAYRKYLVYPNKKFKPIICNEIFFKNSREIGKYLKYDSSSFLKMLNNKKLKNYLFEENNIRYATEEEIKWFYDFMIQKLQNEIEEIKEGERQCF